jgi:hypothetical protein
MIYNSKIPGWMTQADLTVLHRLASLVPDSGSILEIGCFLGRSTDALFRGKQTSVKMTVVDSFQTHDGYSPDEDIFALRENASGEKYIDAFGDKELYNAAAELTKLNGNWLEGFKYCVGKDIIEGIELHQSYSADFKLDDNGYDLAFIDASHKVEDTKADIAKFMSNQRTLIVGDDFDARHYGVAQAILETRRPSAKEIGAKRLLIVPEGSKIWMLVPIVGYWKEQFRNTNSCFFE